MGDSYPSVPKWKLITHSSNSPLPPQDVLHHSIKVQKLVTIWLYCDRFVNERAVCFQGVLHGDAATLIGFPHNPPSPGDASAPAACELWNVSTKLPGCIDLFTTVRPLIEVQLTEEQIRGKDEEIQQLKARLEKVEKERNELRLNTDRLESRITDLSSELADERNTGESASQLLESETSERLRLEKDMKDLQVRLTLVPSAAVEDFL
ncbi:hypothetical protein JZ751_021395 [Albula glossodonta]|uniref:Uncharacterized protein n=1 Tax=Albula glossodonta TaxID=121402 RepID=A0A8T2NIR8_9TELE|nr:hypothetical protein JZ751_021395 [Albula glossodonta]